MGMCESEGMQRCAEEGKSNGKGGGIMATKRELEERIEELENAIEEVKSVSDKALDSDNEEEGEIE
jgi:hypothetical protein